MKTKENHLQLENVIISHNKYDGKHILYGYKFKPLKANEQKSTFVLSGIWSVTYVYIIYTDDMCERQ